MSITAISTALGGMQAASERLEQAAGRIVRAGASIEPTSATTPASTPNAAATANQPVARLSSPASLNSDDLVGGIVDAKLAEISYKANLNVVKVANEMLGALLDITS